MKNRIIVTLALTAVLSSCSSTKKTTSNSTETTTEQMNTVQNATSTKAIKSTTTESPMTQKNMATQVNGSTGAMNTIGAKNSSNGLGTEYSELFTALEMSENQISIFKSSMERFKTKQVNTASGEMLGSIESERTRQMEGILSSAQYAKYEQWLTDNQ